MEPNTSGLCGFNSIRWFLTVLDAENPKPRCGLVSFFLVNLDLPLNFLVVFSLCVHKSLWELLLRTRTLAVLH